MFGDGSAAAVLPDRDGVAGGAGGGGWPWSIADAVAGLGAAVDAAQRADIQAASDAELLDAAVALQRLGDRLAAVQLAVLRQVDARDAFGGTGAVTAAAWLRGRTRVDHGQAVRKVEAARRLARLPALAAALAAGEVSFEHVAAVTRAAVPRRMDAIGQLEDVLVELARRGRPQDVRRAVARIRDLTDRDGADTPPLDSDGLDERRGLDASRTIDGLVAIRGMLDQVQGEALLTVLDAFEQPDAPDTPPARRRSGGQRRADALHAALEAVLDRGDAPQVHKVKPHVTATVDLAALLGATEQARLRQGHVTIDDLAAELAQRYGLDVDRPAGGPRSANDADARPQPRCRRQRGSGARLRFTGELDAERARRLLLQARVLAVLTLGPWRVVNVGRTQRTLPAWLRGALEHVHRHCRGPDCDRPITWSQAHHTHAWVDGGDTDVNQAVPLCQAHHDLVTNHGWHVALDPDTGTCTWTSPTGPTIHTHPHE